MTDVSLERHKEDWERLAEVDPMWAVLTAPDQRGGGWDAHAFFATAGSGSARRRSCAGRG